MTAAFSAAVTLSPVPLPRRMWAGGRRLASADIQRCSNGMRLAARDAEGWLAMNATATLN